MIRKLTIDRYALIDHVEIDFSDGFSVITGETGSGKSILLGALGLILGDRADTKVIQPGASKCIVEAVFDISAYKLHPFFDENELEEDASCTIIRRELSASGKSRAFINDTPVSLALLKTLGEQLIDIHSQHQNLLVGDGRFQLRVVDSFGDCATLYEPYKQTFNAYTQKRRALEELRVAIDRERQEEDFLRFQLEQLHEAAPQSNEIEQLEEEQHLLTHAQEIKGRLLEISEQLDGDESSLVHQLKETLNKARSIASFFPQAAEMADRIESNCIDLREIARDCAREEEKISYDNHRLEIVESRLDLLFRLHQKFQVNSNEELLTRQAEMEAAVNKINHADEAIRSLEEEVGSLYEIARKQAEKLTQSRRKSAKELSLVLEKALRPLGMPSVRFEAQLATQPELTLHGAELIQFRFSANKNQPLQPIAEVASGGEISRLMLVLKAQIAHASALPTLIFDEVDTGVSGEIADKMGALMEELGTSLQVIAITHLPQVAARGKEHYKVYKQDNEEATHTGLVRLNREERLREIAGMLSGTELTQAALKNAAILLHLEK